MQPANTVFNFEQIKGVLERAFYWILLWGVGTGWIPKEQVTELLGVLMTISSLAYGWWLNRQSNLMAAAKATAGTEGMVKEVAKMPEVAKVVAPELSHLSEPAARITNT